MNSMVLHETIGAVIIKEESGFITALRWRPEVAQESQAAPSNPLLKNAAGQLEEYFHGKRRMFDLPLELRGTDFQKSVWRAIAQIPYGKTCSYGSLARKLGTSPRPVGTATGNNPIPILIPCHRVVGKGGTLGGYTGGEGVSTKRRLLRLEGHSAF